MKILLTLLTFVGLLTACAGGGGNTQLDNCPQPRFTGKAPETFLKLSNPVNPAAENIAAGEKLYQSGITPVACSRCHGSKGGGRGPMSGMFDPPPRNFTCAQTINNVPDGQLFWIIRNGSPGTSMPGFSELTDTQVWQIVLYIRRLANGSASS